MATTNLDEYFRIESAELLADLTRGLLNLEKEPGRTDLLDQCFRFAHTLKGAARTARKVQIGELADAIEDTLAQYRETGEPIERANVTDLLAILDTIRLELGELPQTPPDPSTDGNGIDPPSAVADERLKTVRVDIATIEELFDDLSEIGVQLLPSRAGVDELASALHIATRFTRRLRIEQEAGISDTLQQATLDAITELQHHLQSTHQSISSSLERVERTLEHARNVTAALSLVQVNTMIDTLELAGRDAAEALGKEIVFEVDGGNIRIEGQILYAVRDALLHVIRNAVDHGIEKPSDRIAAGKPRAGQIRVEIERKARRVVFRVRDDGRGVDEQAVRDAAMQRGAIDAAHAEELSAEQALQLVFRAGVSTSKTLTAVSGRGVGLDVIRDLANRVRGDVDIQSAKGRGTTVTLEVPVTLASLLVLSVTLATETVLIPLDGVRGTRMVNASEITESPTGGHLLYEGRAVPVVSLGRILGRDDAALDNRLQRNLVFVQFGDRLAAFDVDRVNGVLEVMMRPLPTATGMQSLLAGAAFDPHDDPLLVLDPRGLMSAALDLRPEAHKPQEPAQRLPILIIDDSLTTRMLEQSILESAGYQVDLADSAEAALQMADQRRYGLFVVDVEMPGMNGFEFTACTRANPVYAKIPVMIVTSLASDAERHRGFDAGAAAYFVKGAFDQKQFVDKVAELLGAGHG